MGRKLNFVILSKEELEQLREWMREVAMKKKFRIRLRGNAILLSNQCRTVSQIAADLNRSSRTVYQWLRTYRRKGLAGIMPRTYPKKLSHDQVQELLKISRWYLVGAHSKEFHKRWTFREMSEWVDKTCGIKLSSNRIRQIVNETLLSGDVPHDKPEK